MSKVQCEPLTGRWFASKSSSCWLLFLIFFVAVGASQFGAAQTCSSGILPQGTGGPIVIQSGTCIADASNSPYNYSTVNVIGGGTLCFLDREDSKSVDFWATSILVENNGRIISSGATENCPQTGAGVFGKTGDRLKIHLYGPDQGSGTSKSKQGNGIACATKLDAATNVGPCGVPQTLWDSNMAMKPPTGPCTRANTVSKYMQNLPGNVDDCFYRYMPLIYDGGDPNAYFGYKVLGVSFGGTLQLWGSEGATYTNLTPDKSGTSWVRLNQPVSKCSSNCTLVLDRPVDWKVGDQIVVSSTDYLPGHAEQLSIQGISTDMTTLTVAAIQYPHNGAEFPLPPDLQTHNPPIGPDTGAVETRAAVGLLNRSIRIMSGGDVFGKDLPNPGTKCSNPDPDQPDSCVYFGGHTMFRQGFKAVQIQGVEFYQMGQGGRIMHYPVHFHMTRKTPQPANPTDPPVTYVKDSAVWDSMTRWYVLHGSQQITLERNVGYLSIGHGYYLEDGTETDNKLYANLGIYARAALQGQAGTQINPRNVPGILDAARGPKDRLNDTPYFTDVDHPTLFWIMNGWNDLEYNVASGANSCGVCYWMLPSSVSTMSQNEYWFSYAGESSNPARYGMAPLQKFVGNSCSTAQESLITIPSTNTCAGIIQWDDNAPYLPPVPNPLAPPRQPSDNDPYYSQINNGAIGLRPTVCPAGDYTSCSTQDPCSAGAGLGNCTATVIDHYTTSFNWAETNFSAVWVRPQWYLFTNSAITDVQNGGLTFVSGGGYTDADEIPGRWALARRSVFIGHTQDDNAFASDAGPFNIHSGVVCDLQTNGLPEAAFCLNKHEGITMPLANFSLNQRLFNIYDGPSLPGIECLPENNSHGAYRLHARQWPGLSKEWLDVRQHEGAHTISWWAQGSNVTCPMQLSRGRTRMRPTILPAFHSRNLYFDTQENLPIRHFVIEPLFNPNTYSTNTDLAANRYCTDPGGLFNGYTDIDRQTELSDDDGSLTGLVNTVSVNKDPFFNAPRETAECASDVLDNMPPPIGACDFGDGTLCATAKTSPYSYLTTVVYPDCATQPNGCPYIPPWQPVQDYNRYWSKECDNQNCFGVKLYRLDTVSGENPAHPPYIRMAGQSLYQRSTLTVNHGRYLMDTTVSSKTQIPWLMGGQGTTGCINGENDRLPNDKDHTRGPCTFENVFQGGSTYYLFFLYAHPKPAKGDVPYTKQVYSLYVGPGFDATDANQLFMTRVDRGGGTYGFNSNHTTPVPCSDGKTDNCFTVDPPTQANGYVLTVDVDASHLPTFASEFSQQKKAVCGPESVLHVG